MNYRELTTNDFEILPKGDIINARQLLLSCKTETRIYIFRNTSGSHSCLLQAIPSSKMLPEIRGIKITFETFGKPDEMKIPFIHLECKLPAYNINFVEIIREILADYDTCSVEMTISVDRVIRKWKHFLSDPASELMKEEDIVGLMGELMFLMKIIQSFGGAALKYWTADRGEEDFIFRETIVEVKSTLKERHEHIINGIDQLLLIPERIKYILSFLFVKSLNDDAITLTSLIEKIGGMLAEFPDEEDLFYRKLKSRGYDVRDASGYLKYKYSLFKGGYFRVDESFPKLTTDDLKAPLNPRISKVRYLLDMEGLFNLNFHFTTINEILSYDGL